MNDNEVFKSFGRAGNTVQKATTNNAVIYTRVSTKEQAETNASLDTQKSYCEIYANRNKLNVIASFGGTYESAKTDERKEFLKMLSYLKKAKEKISYIIVYSMDRFSRSGANAIHISEELKKQGIFILSATQNIESHTASGKLQQSMILMFGEFDNDIRKQKTKTGMLDKILQGHWMGPPPLGYFRKKDGATKYDLGINEIGEKLRQAFLWKANEGISNVEIHARLKEMGLNIHIQRLTDIFSKPFYCGIIVSSLLDGEVVDGNHPKLISKEIFLKVNNLQQKNPHGYRQQKEREEYPLKHFIRCADCGRIMTAYHVHKKNKDYYKCNRLGCKNNKSVPELHELFVRLLGNYRVDEKTIAPMKVMLKMVFEQMGEFNKDDKKIFKKSLETIETKISKLEEQHVLGEVNRTLYEKYNTIYQAEKAGLIEKLGEMEFELSNLDEFINFALKISSKLPSMWSSANYSTKLQLQTLVFPEGISYSKKNDDYRTEKVNSFFSLIPLLSADCDKMKNGFDETFFKKSASVPRAGVEPARA